MNKKELGREPTKTSIALKKIMKIRNMKQVDILNACEPYTTIYKVKISKSDLSQYLSSKTTPNQKKLHILSKALNVTPSYLLGLEDDYENKSKKNRIRDLRIKENMTLEDFSKIIEVDTKTIKEWESQNIDKLDKNTANKIAKIFNVTPAYLLGYNLYKAPFTVKIDVQPSTVDFVKDYEFLGDKLRKIVSNYIKTCVKAQEKMIKENKPIYPLSIPLHNDIFFDGKTIVSNNIEDYIILPNKLLENDAEYFAIIANDNSMIKRNISTGDVLIFKMTKKINSGEVGFFQYSKGCLCRVYIETNKGAILMPESSIEKPIFLNNDDFFTIGKLVYKFDNNF